MELKRLNDLQGMEKDTLVNLFLSLQEFTQNTLQENNELKELLDIRRKLDFASSSEHMSSLQMLFDELDIEKKSSVEAEHKPSVSVQAHTRRSPHRILALPPDAPVVDIYHEGSVEDCPICEAHRMVRVEDKIVERMGYEPAKIIVERHHYPQYECRNCEADREAGEKNRVAADYAPQVDNLMAASSLVAHSVVQKFADGLPLYRQAGIFRRNGMEISRQTLSNWLLAYWALLLPLLKKLKDSILHAHLINQDETPILVLNEEPGGVKKNCFMVVQVGTTGNHRVVVFTYVSNRRTETLDSLLKGYQNYVQTDGLKGYCHLEKHIGCWVHGVRALKKILKANPKAENARKICEKAGELYVIENQERERFDLGLSDKTEFMESRRKRASKVFGELKEMMDSMRKDCSPGSAMGKALHYLYTYWDQLIAYINCFEASPSNNIAENAIRPFVCGRKAWLFANTINGAEASALYYSLIETAKVNKLNPYEYIWYVLEKAPKCGTEQEWDSLLPWNFDAACIAMMKARCKSAAPDPDRIEPYVFRGNR